MRPLAPGSRFGRRLLIPIASTLVLVGTAATLWRSNATDDAERQVAPAAHDHRARAIARGAEFESAPHRDGSAEPAPADAASGLLTTSVAAITPHPFPSTTRPLEPPFGAVMPELLAAAAAGSVPAAAQALDVLARCRNAYRTEPELQAAIEQAYNSRSYHLPRESPPLTIPIPESRDLTEFVEQALIQPHAMCKDVPEPASETVVAMQELVASSAGFPGMTLGFANDYLARGQIDAALRFFDLAWRSGSWEALQGTLSAIRSLPPGEPLPAEVVHAMGQTGSRDMVELALLSAHLALHQRMVTSDAGSVVRAKAREARELEALRARLLPWEVEDAERMAAKLIADNPACCTPF